MSGIEDAAAVPYGAIPRLGAIKDRKGMPDLQTPAGQKLDIIDIRHAAVDINLKPAVLSSFCARDGPRTLPTLLLYDERGLQLFEKITYLEEYYLTNDEIEVLQSSATDIVTNIPSGAMLIELGSGNLRKVNLLLQALEDAAKTIDYYALDLSQQELERTLAQLPPYKHVRAHGLLGTYDEGRDWLKDPSNATRQKCILSLGSSVGNFGRDDAAAFLKTFADVLGPGDTMLIGLDACGDPARESLTHEFILNGLRHANQVLGTTAFVEGEWGVVGEYLYDANGGRHQAFYSPLRETTVMGELIRPHDRIFVEQSLKYSPDGATELWKRAGMTEIHQWRCRDEYGLHMITKPKMAFSLIPSVYARTALPLLEDWQALWETWDVVTLEMLPSEEFLEKPINLRNACIFYLGHIPTFLDLQLTKTTKEPPTDPASYGTIFERGIDPDVDNPELCHAHSEVPEEWPPVDEILAYQRRVRSRLQKLYADGLDKIPRHVGRAVWAGFEHELMHLETLLYMMLQSDKTLPPPHVPVPDLEKLAAKARSERVPNEWFDIPAQEITIGLDDPEDGTDTDLTYGWDNEKPARQAVVHAFQAQGRPMSNQEYAQYLYSKQITKIPASWAHTADAVKADGSFSNGVNGIKCPSTLPASFLADKSVRTVYGLVPLEHALDWPVFASYDELAGCAAWMGGRIPTFEETRSIYRHAEALKKKDVENQLGKTVPAVNGHLSNNGVEISPPATPPFPASPTTSAPSRPPPIINNSELFTDLDGANVGFQHWHPVPVTGRGAALAGQAEMGGVWEWTSSALARWEGFAPMELYPGYTADFFDGKHNIVLGGSWATHPRVAGRKTFVNWYQRNYPYAWVGARLVRDRD
ncbi:hypothetical protein BT67DRAFT_452686 [Trichocladium antarcticum]|uniref:Uncharacterized protein n=1 Tax=Trichocladium antarcticum TaxID=1450529 RepID=A0AAN6UBN9_9PEZI|nr:hypothetical protein BT67DRAFT_452686 [Trichocladium antarcticum]